MVHCSSSGISPECSRQNPIGRISGPRSSSNTITTTSPSVLHPTSLHPSGTPTRSSYSLSDFFIQNALYLAFCPPSIVIEPPTTDNRILRFHRFPNRIHLHVFGMTAARTGFVFRHYDPFFFCRFIDTQECAVTIPIIMPANVANQFLKHISCCFRSYSSFETGLSPHTSSSASAGRW